MRIGIDCRLAGPDHAGIGRYSAHLVRELLQLSPSTDWVLFCSNSAQADFLLEGSRAEHVDVVLEPSRHYSLKEQLTVPAAFTKAKLDILHVPHFNVPLLYGKPFVVTIHDLLWHAQRGQAVTTLSPWAYWAKYLGYRAITNHAIGAAKKIFVPSEEIKRTVSHYYPNAKEKIIVTYEGVELRKPERLTQAVPKNYLLFVGSLYPHKNIAVILKALQSLPDLHLVLVGSRSVFSKDVQQLVQLLDLEQRVHFFGRASEGELHTLYQHAKALVQPSFSEGFGLTGIEAMAAGTPVIASDIPIFHEVYQDAALFADPHRPAQFVEAIKQLSQRRQTLTARGKQVIKRYSWKTMAELTFAAYSQH